MARYGLVRSGEERCALARANGVGESEAWNVMDRSGAVRSGLAGIAGAGIAEDVNGGRNQGRVGHGMDWSAEERAGTVRCGVGKR
mgnify:CR=1 FL=1